MKSITIGRRTTGDSGLGGGVAVGVTVSSCDLAVVVVAGVIVLVCVASAVVEFVTGSPLNLGGVEDNEGAMEEGGA